MFNYCWHRNNITSLRSNDIPPSLIQAQKSDILVTEEIEDLEPTYDFQTKKITVQKGNRQIDQLFLKFSYLLEASEGCKFR